jgi:glucan biosynthesis protein C
MGTEQRLFAWGPWASVVAALVVAGAIQVSIDKINDQYDFQGGVSDIITSYLIMLVVGIVYGPLVFCRRGRWDATPVLEPQSYLQVERATEFGDEDADAGAGATLTESMETEGACLESERHTEGHSDTESFERIQNQNLRRPRRLHFLNQTEACSDTESFEQMQNQNPHRPPRLHFLDNVKTCLTALVVSFHVNCAFGGCSSDWYLVVGEYSCAFHYFAKAVRLINVAYFMPLFFFISAYFTPASYDRKGRTAFLRDRGRRLWLPAMITTFTIVPASLIIGWVSMGTSPLYVPFPGHCWFLFWLLALDYAYCTIRKGDSDTAAAVAPGSSEVLTPFPTSFHRYLYGVLVCGLATFAVCEIFDGVLYAMPINIGSLPSHLLLFGVGVLAMRNQWLSRPIEEQMDTPIWYLRVAALLEAVSLLVLDAISPKGFVVNLLFYLVAGIFCLDMSLAILQLFQQLFNFRTPTSRFLADSAYTVYLIHPLVVTSVTSGYIWVYNSFYPDSIIFIGPVPVSTSQLEGQLDGSAHLAIGWVAVNILSHAIVWPLAWGLLQLPGLRIIL